MIIQFRSYSVLIISWALTFDLLNSTRSKILESHVRRIGGIEMGGSMGDFKDLLRIMMTCQYAKSTHCTSFHYLGKEIDLQESVRMAFRMNRSTKRSAAVMSIDNMLKIFSLNKLYNSVSKTSTIFCHDSLPRTWTWEVKTLYHFRFRPRPDNIWISGQACEVSFIWPWRNSWFNDHDSTWVVN